jgi:uncharacterized protein involved in exopolysaccharide biosynthesis
MKTKPSAIALLVITAVVVGCNKEQSASQQLDEIKTETKAAAQDMNDYAFARKAEFVAKMNDQLAAINHDLDQLSARIDKSSETARAEAKPKLQALRDQAADLNKQLDTVRNATESTWSDVKSSSQKAFASLKDGFQQSRQWVSDKIAP